MSDTIASLDWGVVARVVHVLAVIVWIGGVWFVTAVVLPAMPPRQWLRELDAVERRFARQVRIAMLLVLLSGLAMLQQYDMWSRFSDAAFWWMHLMVGVWLLFAVLLFVLEPLVMHRFVARRAAAAPEATLRLVLWFHRVMLALSLLAAGAAVGGAHGLF